MGKMISSTWRALAVRRMKSRRFLSSLALRVGVIVVANCLAVATLMAGDGAKRVCLVGDGMSGWRDPHRRVGERGWRGD